MGSCYGRENFFLLRAQLLIEQYFLVVGIKYMNICVIIIGFNGLFKRKDIKFGEEYDGGGWG